MGKSVILILMLLLLITLLPLRALAASLYIDGFRIYSSGTVNLTDHGGDGRVKAVAVQPWDGKVIIGGIFTATGGTPKSTLYNLARLNTDGTLDQAFTTTVDGPINAVVVQMDKSDPPQPLGILLGGSFTKITDGSGDHLQNGLARLNIDGSVDATFDPATQAGTVINVMVVHPTANSILVGGAFTDLKGLPAGTTCSNIARISGSDGTFQGAFSGGVSVGVNQAVNAIVVQPNGKVVAGGDFQLPQAYLVRFHDTGELDSSFIPAPNGVVRALAIQADWSIVAGGDFTSVTTSNFPAGLERQHLARLTNDGLLDGLNPAPDGAVKALAVQPDGKLVLAGTFSHLTGILDEDGAAILRNRVARLGIDGTLDDMDAKADGEGEVAVEALVLQPDEKLLIGGRFSSAADKPRSMLARYYGFGTLDDDVANIGPTMDFQVSDVVLEPSGMVTLWGEFKKAWGQKLLGLARLNPDWTLADSPIFNGSANMDWGTHGWLMWSPLLDDKYTLIAGSARASFQDWLCTHSWLVPTDAPEVDLTIPYNAQRYADVPQLYTHIDFTHAAVEAPDGLIYLAGSGYQDVAAEYDTTLWGDPYFLTKLDRNGNWDGTFDAPVDLVWPVLSPQMLDSDRPYVEPRVNSMLIEPGPTKDDYKFIIGTKYGYIFRLNKNGTLDPTFNVLRPAMVYDSDIPDWDPTFTPTYLPFAQYVTSLTFDKDGQIIAGGYFDYTFGKDGKTWHRNLIRINHNRPGYQDGTIDDTFNVGVGLDPQWNVTTGADMLAGLNTVAVQTDGSVLIAGWFDRLTDATGNTFPIHDVARIGPDGKVDPGINFGTFGAPQANGLEWLNQVAYTRLQPDGKGLITGVFDQVNGDTSKARVLRFAAGWASQELTVSTDGSKITWTRGIDEPDTSLCGRKVCGGGAPELKRALFYYSEEGSNWELLGEAVRTAPTKWELSGLNLGRDKGWNQNRYIRARGLMTGDNGGGKFLETVRVYYLTPQVTVKAQPQSVPAGSIFSFVPQYIYADGTKRALTPVAASLRGAPVYSTDANASSPPGDYTVSADVTNFSSWMYGFVAGDSTLTLTAVSGGGTINVSADPQTKTYGGNDPTLTYTVSPALPNGVTISGSLTRNTGETVAGGPYAIRQGTLAISGGYTINFTGSTLKIDPKSVTVTAEAKAKTYGSADPAFTYTVNPTLVGSDTLAGALTRASGETVTGGPYAIQQGSLANPDYSITYLGANLTIQQKPVTVTAVAATKTYGSADPAFTYSVNPALIGSDTLGGTLTRASGETVAGGPYAIQQGSLANPNYSITYLGANLTIQQKPVTVTAEAKIKSYGSADPAFTYSVNPPLLSSDTLAGALARAPGESVAGGPYAIQQGNLANPNYSISYVGAALTIEPKAVTVTADAKTKGYGDADPALTYTVTPDLVGSDSFTGSLSRAPGETVAGAPYAIQQGTLALSSNYSLNFTSSNLSITPKAVTVTAVAKTKTYGEADPALTYTVSPDLVGSDGFTGSLSRAPGETVAGGPYAIQQGTLSLSSNYAMSYMGATMSIAPKAVTVTATARTKTYGDLDPVLTYTVAPSLVGSDAFTGTLSRVPGESVAAGPYPIQQGSLTLSSNYTLLYVPAILVISQKVVTVTAQAKTKVYGAADPPLTYTFAPALAGSDTFTGSLSRAPGESVAGSPYAIQQGTLTAGNDYAISFTGASLAISKASASVVPMPAGKIYGDDDPPLTGTLSGFLPADSVAAIFWRTVGETVAGGPYPIAATLSPAAALANYNVTYNQANFTIAKRSATVTANDAGKTYGQVDPALPISTTGFVTADLGAARITASATRASGETVRSYDVSPAISDNGSALLSNYTPQLLHGTFTIAKAPLTITADNQSRPYGAANPTFTVQYSGLASFDTVASLGGDPLVTTTADLSSQTGSYPITVSLGSITSPNYNYSFVNGVLTIGAAGQTITFAALRPKTYGDADFDPGATASSGLPVSYASSLPGVATAAGSMIRIAAPGSVQITASQSGNASYLAAPDVVRTLVVNPPPGNCLDFDGVDDLLRIKDAAQLNFGGKTGFTIETWLHLNGSQPDGTGLVSKGTTTAGGAGYQLILQQNRIAAEISDGKVTSGAAQGLKGTTNLDDGYWHHVALSVDRAAATASLYLDGRVEATVSDPDIGINPDSSDDMLVGVDRGGSRFFRGDIDELRLWDAARSQDEIRNNLSQVIDPLNEPHLAAYYHFDEGDAGGDNATFVTAPDRTANGANGSLQGFALSGTAFNWLRSGAFIPLLETAPLAAVTSVSATGGGLIYPDYHPATDAGLCWGSTFNPGLSDTCVHSAGGSGAFSAPLTGLTPGAAYHVRAFAVNAMGTAFGNDVALQAARVDQTITVAAIADRTYGNSPFQPSGTASSGLPITYTSSDPAVAVVDNGFIRIVGAGSTVITASQGGSGTFNAAPAISIPMNVLKAPLTVTADDKSRAYQTPNPNFTASYAGFVNGDGPAVLSGAPAFSTSASVPSPVGSYPIMVDTSALAAPNYRLIPVNGTLNVYRSCQLIIFPAIPEKTFGDPPFTVSASACSDLGLTFASTNPQVALVTGNLVTITGAGSTLITASQHGSDSLDQAPDVSQLLVVHKSGQAVSLPSLAQKVVGDPPFTLGATASSGLPVSYLSSDPAVATVRGNTAIIEGAGTTVITATQAGNNNFEAALPASQPLTIALEGSPPTVTVSTLSTGAVTDNPVLNVTGSAADQSGIASLTINDIDVTDRASLFSTAVSLLPGDTNITVAARDGAGNTTSETVVVTLDAGAPAISLSQPPDNSVTNDSTVTVAGSVAAGSGLTMVINGGAPQSLPVTDGSFSGMAALQPGMNTIELAADLQERVSRAKRTVTYAAGMPSVAITEPGEDIRSESESVLIRGTADLPGSELTVTIDSGGPLFTPGLLDGGFQQQVPLKATGATRITATVTDGSGNSSVAYRNVLRVPRLLGDVNGDGRVDISDAVLALRISTGIDPVTADALAHADVAPLVNGVPQPDGKIDVGDVVVILRKVIGLVDF